MTPCVHLLQVTMNCKCWLLGLPIRLANKFVKKLAEEVHVLKPRRATRHRLNFKRYRVAAGQVSVSQF